MEVFDQIINQNYTAEEQAELAQSAALYLRQTDYIYSDCEINDDRIESFRHAHTHGYSAELYEVMRRSRFIKPYLSAMSSLALNNIEEKGGLSENG